MLAQVLVLLAGTYLVGLGSAAIVSPQRVRRFLGGFASTASAHFLELFVRLVIGTAVILHAPEMKFSGLFATAGWVVVLTTVGFLAFPWRWHRRFARWSVPYATSNMPLLAVGSLAGGLFLLVSFFLGPGAG